MSAPSRSLVIAPQWIGDAVMTEPLLRRLHARGEQLTVAALSWVAPIYRAMPQVAEVIELPFVHAALQWCLRYRLAKQLVGRFERAYVCPNSVKSALLPFLARIPKRIGYQGEMRFGLLTQRLRNPRRAQRPPMVAFYSALAGSSDIDTPQLQLAPIDRQAALDKFGLQRKRYYVLCPGAEYGPAKRWPASHFGELAGQMDLPVLLLGSAKETDLCDEIMRCAMAQPHHQARLLNLAGETSLLQALALIAECRCVVSNDSGLMHVAAGFGVPQVAIFGSSSPLHTPPLNARARVLWLKSEVTTQPPLDCAPCFARTCRYGHTRCLTQISAARVLQNLPIA